MKTWQERELDERLPNEFEKRGFYQLGNAPSAFAPMPYGFRSRENCTKFLSIIKEEYDYVAFKNMAVKTGTADEQTVIANMFVKLGSLSREPCPVAEITAFYQGRMYKYVNKCYHFIRWMQDVRSGDDIQEAVDGLMRETERLVDTWWRSVRTLIVEGRWPEEEFVSDVRFMDDVMEKEYGISKED